jgi:hypothetical protein
LTGAVEMERLQNAPLGLEKAGAGWLLAWLLLGVVGMMVQYRKYRSH